MIVDAVSNGAGLHYTQNSVRLGISFPAYSSNIPEMLRCVVPVISVRRAGDVSGVDRFIRIIAGSGMDRRASRFTTKGAEIFYETEKYPNLTLDIFSPNS